MIARVREWALRLLLLAVACGVALALLEAWVRARDLPKDEATLLRAHPGSPRLVRLEPGASARFTGVPVRANRFGYRGPDWEVAKPTGAFRIALLGDSQTFGYGVREDDAYPASLERALRGRDPGRAWEVLNFAMIGFNTAQEAEACSLDALGFEPDLVILAFFPNDVDPPVRPVDVAARPAAPTGAGTPDARGAWSARRWLGTLRTPQFLRTRGAALARRLGVRVETATSRYAALYAARGPAWRSCEDALRAARGACAARGARFAVVVLPFIVSLDETHPMTAAHRQVDAFCRAEAIPCLDLLPAFLGHSAARLSVSPVNNHMNAEGNRIAADAILGWLVASGLIEEERADSARAEAVGASADSAGAAAGGRGR
jgi:lysophospholipase L1-like esterase